MSELGAGTRGASLGLAALKMASFEKDLGFFNDFPVKKVKTLNNRLFKKSTRKFAKRLDGIEEMYRNIEKEVSGVLKDKNFPLVLSGDHSNAGGTIAGIKTAFPKKRLGVIWIDAHSDLHSPYTSPSGNVHGMPLATALNDDNIDNQNNEPSQETIWHWNELKGSNQRVRHSDLFFIAVRDYEEPEKKLMDKHNIPNITTEQLREKGIKQAAAEALNYLKECDIIYISFDVDSMDPSVSRGTGTPVPGGLLAHEARDLILHLLDDQRVCCLEMTEINPLLDEQNKMAKTAFDILRAIAQKINKKLS